MNSILKSLLIFLLIAAAGFAADMPMVAEWRKKAEAGDAVFQELMGEYYADDASSDGIPLDYAEAIKWFRLAADQGNANAQCNLGVMYANGRGVPKDEAEAVKWYRLAAEQGNAAAQSNLGVMYHNGDGVPKDEVQAHVWWNIAGAKGDEDAKKNLAIVEKQMTSEQKAEAMKLARELFAKLPKGK